MLELSEGTLLARLGPSLGAWVAGHLGTLSASLSLQACPFMFRKCMLLLVTFMYYCSKISYNRSKPHGPCKLPWEREAVSVRGGRLLRHRWPQFNPAPQWGLRGTAGAGKPGAHLPRWLLCKSGEDGTFCSDLHQELFTRLEIHGPGPCRPSRQRVRCPNRTHLWMAHPWDPVSARGRERRHAR